MNPFVCALASMTVTVAMAFANVEVGSVIPNPSLPGFDGTEHALVEPDRITAFVFFSPDHQHCREVLKEIADLQNDLADAGFRWVGIVSDRFLREAVSEAVEAAGADLILLVDTGDALYGDLGVRLYPTIGIVDGHGVLRAYLPYAKVNYMAAVEAHLRHAAGLIDDQQLQAALHPTSFQVDSDAAGVSRNLKFARMLLNSGKLDKALGKAVEAEEAAPGSSEAHAVVGVIFVEMGNCDEGRGHLQAALEIDPGNTEAAEALARCGD